LSQMPSTPSRSRWSRRLVRPGRSPMPSPFESAKERTYTWYRTASRHQAAMAAQPTAIVRGAVCFELDSLPPIPVMSGAAVSHDDLELEARDGNRLAAFSATPEEPGEVGVVILPDVRGLYRFYEELALRFAERGIAAVAFDYFGRTAGVGKRDDAFPYMEHVAQTTPEGIQADVAAAVAELRSRGVRSIFT